tara:strand:+ start:187 stop:348 length:162 start_codon:yes stop_codon:yes gene_type:complete
LNKRTYKKHKEYATDISFENEVDKSFLDDIANNTPHAEQFEEKNLDKKKKRSL